MTHTIYVDVYFCLNFLMDFVVLFITRIIVKDNKKIYRLTLAAGLGALYATIILIFHLNGIVAYICTYFIMAQLMCMVAFGRAGLKKSLKNILILYMVTFTLSGGINAIYYSTNLGKNIIEKANAGTFGNISISFILCFMVTIVTIVIAIKDIVRKNLKMSQNIFPVSIYVGSKKISIMALCDTGNSLFDPITKKPVSVIEQSSLSVFDMTKMKYLVVPYNTVGKSHGLLNAFIADSMEVNGNIIKNAVIGIHQGKLSQNRKYEMILHPSIIENKEK